MIAQFVKEYKLFFVLPFNHVAFLNYRTSARGLQAHFAGQTRPATEFKIYLLNYGDTFVIIQVNPVAASRRTRRFEEILDMLTSGQRAFLRGLANSLDPVIMVGKGGVTDTVIDGAENAIKSRELIKGRALEASPVTSGEAARLIAEGIGADVVQVIGRCFLLYKPNPEKKKEEASVSYMLKRGVK